MPRPSFITPCAPVPADAPPTGPEWLHEVKWDGWRCQVLKDGARVTICSRNGTSWTKRLPHLERAIQQLPWSAITLDAELLHLDENGRVNFYGIPTGMKQREVFLTVFDIMHLDDRDLRHLPLIERKDILSRRIPSSPHLVVGEYFDNGDALLDACTKHDMEGIVSKRRDLAYKSGKCTYWRKIKCAEWKERNKERYKLFERA